MINFIYTLFPEKKLCSRAFTEYISLKIVVKNDWVLQAKNIMKNIMNDKKG